ncbi:MAG: tetraacyldisaccharide 4'-kinase [Planctomycetes bacterium]|nr:tetraacyldisaccharide 4'-kinase [Planctomycetota bacterium]
MPGVLLRPFSLLFGLVASLRGWLYDVGALKVRRVSVPVISVGNLSTGGTGKTPVTELVASILMSRRVKVAIVSRGYKADESGKNDEFRVLEMNLPGVPQVMCADRVFGAETAIEKFEAEAIVLDDGFSHRRLHRDLDIVLVDALRPVTQDRLLPEGRLRERISALRRASCIVITRTESVPEDEARRMRDDLATRFAKPVFLGATEPLDPWRIGGGEVPISELRGRKMLVFSGTGNPEAFRRTIESLGVSVSEFISFPDHHHYTAEDLYDRVLPAAKKHGLVARDVICTQKDAVKIRELRPTSLDHREILFLPINVKVSPGPEFEKMICSILSDCERTNISRNVDDGFYG